MSNNERRAGLDRRREAFDVVAKNREVFTRVHTIQSIPSTMFVAGLFLTVLIYILGKSFFLVLIFAVTYFPMMYLIHKDDIHGFRIWLACWGDNTLVWECGRRQKINFILNEKE